MTSPLDEVRFAWNDHRTLFVSVGVAAAVGLASLSGYVLGQGQEAERPTAFVAAAAVESGDESQLAVEACRAWDTAFHSSASEGADAAAGQASVLARQAAREDPRYTQLVNDMDRAEQAAAEIEASLSRDGLSDDVITLGSRSAVANSAVARSCEGLGVVVLNSEGKRLAR